MKLILFLLLFSTTCEAQMYRGSRQFAKSSTYPKPKVYATWNPSDKSVNITLSGSNLIATSTNAAFDYQVRSTQMVHNRKVYFETVTTRNTGSDPFFVVIGVSKIGENVNQYTGISNGACMTTDGQKWINGVGSAYTTAITDGDIIGVELDMTLGAGSCTLKLFKNDVSLGILVSNLTGPIFIGTGSYQTLGYSTTNFGPNFVYSSTHLTFEQGIYTQ